MQIELVLMIPGKAAYADARGPAGASEEPADDGTGLLRPLREPPAEVFPYGLRDTQQRHGVPQPAARCTEELAAA